MDRRRFRSGCFFRLIVVVEKAEKEVGTRQSLASERWSTYYCQVVTCPLPPLFQISPSTTIILLLPPSPCSFRPQLLQHCFLEISKKEKVRRFPEEKMLDSYCQHFRKVWLAGTLSMFQAEYNIVKLKLTGKKQEPGGFAFSGMLLIMMGRKWN